MNKLSKKSMANLQLLQEYLKTDIGKDGVLLNDNELTYIWFLRKIELQKKTIKISGVDSLNTYIADKIDFSDFHLLYRGAKTDEDFLGYINNKKRLLFSCAQWYN